MPNQEKEADERKKEKKARKRKAEATTESRSTSSSTRTDGILNTNINGNGFSTFMTSTPSTSAASTSTICPSTAAPNSTFFTAAVSSSNVSSSLTTSTTAISSTSPSSSTAASLSVNPSTSSATSVPIFYEIKDILGVCWKRKEGTRKYELHYEVNWENYPPEATTFEPEENFLGPGSVRNLQIFKEEKKEEIEKILRQAKEKAEARKKGREEKAAARLQKKKIQATSVVEKATNEEKKKEEELRQMNSDDEFFDETVAELRGEKKSLVDRSKLTSAKERALAGLASRDIMTRGRFNTVTGALPAAKEAPKKKRVSQTVVNGAPTKRRGGRPRKHPKDVSVRKEGESLENKRSKKSVVETGMELILQYSSDDDDEKTTKMKKKTSLLDKSDVTYGSDDEEGITPEERRKEWLECYEEEPESTVQEAHTQKKTESLQNRAMNFSIVVKNGNEKHRKKINPRVKKFKRTMKKDRTISKNHASKMIEKNREEKLIVAEEDEDEPSLGRHEEDMAGAMEILETSPIRNLVVPALGETHGENLGEQRQRLLSLSSEEGLHGIHGHEEHEEENGKLNEPNYVSMDENEGNENVHDAEEAMEMETSEKACEGQKPMIPCGDDDNLPVPSVTEFRRIVERGDIGDFIFVKGRMEATEWNRHLRYIDKDGRSILHALTSMFTETNAQDLFMAIILTDKGAGEGILHGLIAHQDTTGRTALHCAVANGQLEQVKLLLVNNAPLNKVDIAGRSPLELAFSGNYAGSPEIFRRLLRAGADYFPLLQAGRTPPLEAIKNELEEHISSIDALLSKYKRMAFEASEIGKEAVQTGHAMVHSPNDGLRLRIDQQMPQGQMDQGMQTFLVLAKADLSDNRSENWRICGNGESFVAQQPELNGSALKQVVIDNWPYALKIFECPLSAGKNKIRAQLQEFRGEVVLAQVVLLDITSKRKNKSV